MKKIILFTITFFIYQTNFAQDTIVRYSGEKINAKVLEISSTDIKYKKAGFLDGPTFVENKNDIYMIKYSNGTKDMIGNSEKRVEMTLPSKENTHVNESPKEASNKIEGYYKTFIYKDRTIDEGELHSILTHTKDRKIMALVTQAKKAKGLQNVVWGTIPFGVATIVSIPYFIGYAFNYNNNINTTRFTESERNKYGFIAAGCLVGTITCPVISSVFANKRKNCNDKAVQLYNQKY